MEMKIKKHIDQMQANEVFMNELLNNNSKYRDWIITVVFYTALHKIDSLLHKLGVGNRKIKNHYERNNNVKQKLPRKIYKDYHALYLESKRVRYEQDNLFSINDTDLNKYISLWTNSIKSFK